MAKCVSMFPYSEKLLLMGIEIDLVGESSQLISQIKANFKVFDTITNMQIS